MSVTTCPISGGIKLHGPRSLARRGMGIKSEPGVYVVSSGDCISYVGSSGRLGDRIRTLAHLGTHRGARASSAPRTARARRRSVWWAYTKSVARARGVEADLKLERETEVLRGLPPVRGR